MSNLKRKTQLINKLRTSFSDPSQNFFSAADDQSLIANNQLSTDPSTTQKLAVLEQVLDEVELKNPIVQSIDSAVFDNTHNDAQVSLKPARKELEPSKQLDEPAADLAPVETVTETVTEPVTEPEDQIQAESKKAVEVVEAVPSVPEEEIAPEVAVYLERVQDHEEEAPKEVVLATGIEDLPSEAHPPVAKPVIVIPITPQTAKEAKNKSPKYSIRWLWEFCKKMMRMFKGAVIYRETS